VKNIMVCVVTAAWLARAASAQGISRLDLECSLDGVMWSHHVVVDGSVAGGTDVLLRARISWISPTPAYGFGSLTFQPVIGNGRPGIDLINPFVDRGSNTTGGGVDLDDSPLDGPFGRVRPFAAVAPSGTTYFTPHVHEAGSGGAPLGSYLRIARSDVTRWMGTGPTSGTAAINNFNGAGGVSVVQRPYSSVRPEDPPYNFTVGDVTILQLSLHVGDNTRGPPRVLTWEAPTAGMSRNSTTGAREASWFADLQASTATLKGIVEVSPATISILGGPALLYVNAAAGSGGDGLSWDTAFRDLQDALDAVRFNQYESQIWVARGTYRPDRGTGSREATFQLVGGVTLIGGFAGTESNASQRNPQAHPTILSGDLGAALSGSDRVMTAQSLTTAAEVVGFTIQGAFPQVPAPSGGGLFASASLVKLTDCTVTDHRTYSGLNGGTTLAGIIAIDGSQLQLTRCRIARNSGLTDPSAGPFGSDGGIGWGILCDQSTVELTDCAISQNSGGGGGSGSCTAGVGWNGGNGGDGGGLSLRGGSRARIVNSIFVGNTPGGGGGGAYCTVRSGAAGSSGSGGGIFVSGSTIALTNCTFASNSSAIVGMLSGSTLDNCIIWNNRWSSAWLDWGAIVRYSSLAAACPGPGNRVGDPGFVDLAGADLMVGTQDDDLRLSRTSPCIDAGDNAALERSVLLDLNGDARFVDVPFAVDTGMTGGEGGLVLIDMGAYERQVPCPADYNGDGGIDGSDVGAFFHDWEAGAASADLNADGGIDGSDVGAFFEHWEAGC
jgi:hypothetical protein